MNRVWLLIHIAILLISCREKPSEDNHNIFKYNSSNNISSLDPAFARTQENIWICKQLFSGLVQLDENLQVVPDIAESWTINEENNLYTFKLKEAVYFHASAFWNTQARKVTSFDFKHSFLRILNKKTASPGRWIFSNIIDSSSIWCEGDSILKIKLKKRFPPFLNQLAMPYCFVIPKEISNKKKIDFGKNPIGCGPFQLTIWQKGSRLLANRNMLYHGELPKIDGFSVQFIPNKQIAFLQFKKGKLDFFSGIESSFKDHVISKNGKLKRAYQSKFYLQTKPFLNVEYIGFNMQNRDAKNIFLRKAIHHAINRKNLVKHLRNGLGTPGIGGFIPIGLTGYRGCKDSVFDPQRAEKLVLNHGLTNKEIVLTTTKDYEDMALFIAGELDKVGLDLKINVVPAAVLRQGKSEGEFSLFRGSWIADYPDGQNFLSSFYSKNIPPDGPNYFGYKNPKFDELYEENVEQIRERSNSELYLKMQKILEDDMPLVVLFYDKSIHLLNKRVKNFKVNSLNHIDLRSVSLVH